MIFCRAAVSGRVPHQRSPLTNQHLNSGWAAPYDSLADSYGAVVRKAQNRMSKSTISRTNGVTKRLPHLTSIRAFEAAARHLNFTRAAEELGVTQAAVSQQVRALETTTGQQLFARTSGRLALTPAGETLAENVSEAFDILRTAFKEFRTRDESSLSISVLPSLAATWLTPRLKHYQSAHPSIALKVQASHMQPLDVHGNDIGIWTGLGTWPNLRSHELFPINFTPMCSPEFLASHGPLLSPPDLLSVPLIARYDPWWRLWFSAAGFPDIPIPDGSDISFGAQNLEHVAAVNGEGVALLTPYLFREDLSRGRLVMLSDVIANDGRSYWLVYPEARRRSSKITSFRNWLLAEAHASRTLEFRRFSTTAVSSTEGS